jgi:hypothetical protein
MTEHGGVVEDAHLRAAMDEALQVLETLEATHCRSAAAAAAWYGPYLTLHRFLSHPHLPPRSQEPPLRLKPDTPAKDTAEKDTAEKDTR